MPILTQLNAPPIYLICGGIIAFVAILCVIFLVRAWRAGVALGMDKTKMKMYTVTYRLIDRAVSSSTGLPSKRTVWTECGWIIRLISRLVVLNRITTLDIFRPPAVDPAHPPINMIVRRMTLESVGHRSKFTVA